VRPDFDQPGLAALGDRSAAVLTGPAIAARTQAWADPAIWPGRHLHHVRVSLQHNPLTAHAALL